MRNFEKTIKTKKLTHEELFVLRNEGRKKTQKRGGSQKYNWN